MWDVKQSPVPAALDWRRNYLVKAKALPIALTVENKRDD
jgi:hypothetical protein